MPEIIKELDPRIAQTLMGSELSSEAQGPDIWEIIVKYNGDIEAVGKALDAETEILSYNYAILTLARDKVLALYEYPQVEYIELPKTLVPTLQESTGDICVRGVQNADGYNLSGAGVLVAIIDSGIDYRHHDFCRADGTTRIVSIWDQSADTGTPPPGFSAGTLYTAEDLNRALASPEPYRIIPQLDYVGHGTAVAGIAAGNGRSSGGAEVGMAPEASIVAVKLGQRGRESFARTTELMRGVKYVTDQAKALKMPLVINISYGTNNGSHDGGSLFETYLDDMAQQWETVLVVASGNEGTSGHHFGATVAQNQVVEVEFSTVAGLSSFYLSIWKDFADSMSFELISPSGMSSGEIRHNYPSTLIHMDEIIVYVLYGQPTHYNPSQEIYFQFGGGGRNIPAGIWKVKVRGLDIVTGDVDMWLPVTEDVTESTAFVRPTTDTTLTIPSTAATAITVGAYDSSLGSAAAFSGRGYTRGNHFIKPDLVAPGVDVLTTRTGGGYGTFTGTSVAAPFVAGAAALMMQWGIVQKNDPFMYGQRVKAFLHRGAARTASQSYPNSIWGYGTLCLGNAMEIAASYNEYRKVP